MMLILFHLVISSVSRYLWKQLLFLIILAKNLILFFTGHNANRQYVGGVGARVVMATLLPLQWLRNNSRALRKGIFVVNSLLSARYLNRGVQKRFELR